ncbi:MAG: nucleotidyltransferase family protein [FCB group bacterium]|nr:nucleotidyltransferase family protein [FCB group bacterium]
MNAAICMIITAAGLSRRNPEKLLYRLGTQTVIRQCVSQYANFSWDIVVVTGHERKKIEGQLQQLGSSIKFVRNPDYREGLASSLSAGLCSVPDHYTYYGFSNGDKPFIRPGTIRKLMEFLQANRPLILFPKWKTQIGHPAFFHRSLRSSLLGLSGDAGGRQLIPEHQDETVYLQVEDEGVCLDMDRYFLEKTARGARTGNGESAS